MWYVVFFNTYGNSNFTKKYKQVVFISHYETWIPHKSFSYGHLFCSPWVVASLLWHCTDLYCGMVNRFVLSVSTIFFPVSVKLFVMAVFINTYQYFTTYCKLYIYYVHSHKKSSHQLQYEEDANVPNLNLVFWIQYSPQISMLCTKPDLDKCLFPSLLCFHRDPPNIYQDASNETVDSELNIFTAKEAVTTWIWPASVCHLLLV